MAYSEYYQAHIPPKTCWQFTALFRSNEHMAFDRTLDVKQSIFEFFVPINMEADFLVFMQDMQELGLAQNMQKLPNRMAQSAIAA